MFENWCLTGLENIAHHDNKVHGAHIGPIWGRQDPGEPHVGPMNFAIWALIDVFFYLSFICYKLHVLNWFNRFEDMWIYIFILRHSLHGNGTGRWNPSLWKSTTCLSNIINTMAVNDLETLGGKASTAMRLAHRVTHICISKPCHHWFNTGASSVRPQGTYSNKILFASQRFSFKMHLKIPFA